MARIVPSEACTFSSVSCASTWCKGDGSLSLGICSGRSCSGSMSASRLCAFFVRCQSITRCRAMAKSHASNFDLPSYWWPRSSTRIQVSWKKSSARFVAGDIHEVAEQPVLILLDQTVQQVRVAPLQAARDAFGFIAHQRGKRQHLPKEVRAKVQTSLPGSRA